MQNRVPLTLGGQFYMSWDMLLALIMRSARPLLCNQSLEISIDCRMMIYKESAFFMVDYQTVK